MGTVLHFGPFGGNIVDQDLVQKAAQFLDDCIHQRDFKMHRTGKWPTRCDWLLNHQWTVAFLIGVSLFYLLLIVDEP